MCDFYNAAAAHTPERSCMSRRCTFCSLSPLSQCAQRECQSACVFVCELNWNHSPVGLFASRRRGNEAIMLQVRLAIEIWWECVLACVRGDVKLYLKWVWAVTEWHSGWLKLFVSWKWEGFAINGSEFFNWSESVFLVPIDWWLTYRSRAENGIQLKIWSVEFWEMRLQYLFVDILQH